MRSTTPTPPGAQFQPFSERRIASPDLDTVLAWMRKFAHEGKQDLIIRRTMDDVCRGLQSNDYAGEALAAYYWVCRGISTNPKRWGRYARDPTDVEYIQTPREVLRSGAADCDEIATLLAAMLMAYGNTCVFRVAAFGRPAIPSHVFCMVRTPGGLVPLDPVANRETAAMSRRMTGFRDYPV